MLFELILLVGKLGYKNNGFREYVQNLVNNSVNGSRASIS